MIGPVMIEHVNKHDKRHDGEFLTLSGFSYQHVASVASELKVKRSIDQFFYKKMKEKEMHKALRLN